MKISNTNWLAIGIALGSGLGVVYDNVGLGIVIGTFIGALLAEISKR